MVDSFWQELSANPTGAKNADVYFLIRQQTASTMYTLTRKVNIQGTSSCKDHGGEGRTGGVRSDLLTAQSERHRRDHALANLILTAQHGWFKASCLHPKSMLFLVNGLRSPCNQISALPTQSVTVVVTEKIRF